MTSSLTSTAKVGEIRRVGWIGLGVMGLPLAHHVARAGFELATWSRSGQALDRGVATADAATLAAESDLVCTMLGGPDEVAQVWRTLIDAGRPGLVLVDLTTSAPDLAAALAHTAATKAIGALDAPVTGGSKGANAGTLTVMAGGTAATLERARPVLATFASEIQHFGAPGAGQQAKAVNQVAVAGVMQGLAEALLLARHAGLDREQVLATLATGTARSFLLDAYGTRLWDGDTAPTFALRHFAKDLRLAAEEASRHGLDLPGAGITRALYDSLDAAGRGDDGIQALPQALEAT